MTLFSTHARTIQRVPSACLLDPAAEPISFGDEMVNKAVYAGEFSQRVSSEVVQRLAGLHSAGRGYLSEALRAWRIAFNKLPVCLPLSTKRLEGAS